MAVGPEAARQGRARCTRPGEEQGPPDGRDCRARGRLSQYSRTASVPRRQYRLWLSPDVDEYCLKASAPRATTPGPGAGMGAYPRRTVPGRRRLGGLPRTARMSRCGGVREIRLAANHTRDQHERTHEGPRRVRRTHERPNLHEMRRRGRAPSRRSTERDAVRSVLQTLLTKSTPPTQQSRTTTPRPATGATPLRPRSPARAALRRPGKYTPLQRARPPVFRPLPCGQGSQSLEPKLTPPAMGARYAPGGANRSPRAGSRAGRR